MIALAFKLLRPQGKRSELLLFLLALIIAVASVSAVTLMADRLNQALKMSSRDFIAADKVLRSSFAIEPRWLLKAEDLGLRHSTTLNFNSMLFINEQFQLSSVRAVDSNYPLRGELVLSPSAVPELGKIWLSAQLMALLQVKLGDLIEVGNAELSFAGQVITEPDAGFSPFSLAPLALIHMDDLAKLEVVQAGSKVTWRYLFSGDETAIKTFTTWLRPQLTAGQKFYGVDQANTAISMPLQRAEHFYSMAALIGVLLGALAMGITLRHYAQSQLDTVALLKTLGASSRQVMQIYWGLLLLIVLLGIVFGLFLGTMVQALLIMLLDELVPQNLPAPSMVPLALIVVMAVLLTFITAYGPLANLLKTPPLRVVRRDLSPLAFRWPSVVLLALGPVALLWLVSGELLLSVALLLGLTLVMLLVGFMSWLLLILAKKIVTTGAIHLALQRLHRHQGQTITQLAGMATALLLMAMVLNLSDDLSYIWQQRLPENAANRFMMNISPQDVNRLEQTLQLNGIIASDMVPMLRARMVAVNGLSLKEWFDGQVPERIARERNLTWLKALPKGNQIVAGNWWQQAATPGISLEQGYAERAQIQLGDNLTFSVDGQMVRATVLSIRRVDWQSMQPNFFVVFSPEVLTPFPATYLASFYLPKAKLALERQIARQFPTSSVINVGTIIAQIDSVINKVSRALSLMVAIVIGAALLVMLALLQVSMRERQQELVLMRTLGAQAGLMRRAIRWELLTTGLIAGIVAAMSVEAAGFVLNTFWLELPWRAHLTSWYLLPSLGALLSVLSGSWQLRPVVNNVLAQRLKVF